MYELEYSIEGQRLWQKEIKMKPRSRPKINAIMNKYDQTGSVLTFLVSDISVSTTDKSTVDEIASILTAEHQTATHRMSSLSNILKTSTVRVYKRIGL